jgi:hypothetical protein
MMQWVQRVQKRVAVTANMLGNVKVVKMLGFSELFSDIITNLRLEELKTSEKFRGLLIWQIVICKSCLPPRR